MNCSRGKWKTVVTIRNSGISGTLGVAGGAVGAAMFPLNPAAGAVTGAVIVGIAGKAWELFAEDVAERVLSKAETRRVNSVLYYGAESARIAAESGAKLREDSFFNPNVMGTSSFEEIAEAALQKAKNEGQERKIPFIGHLIASSAYRADVSSDNVFALLKSAENLSYRQFCLLSLAGQNKPSPMSFLISFSHANARWQTLAQEAKELFGTYFSQYDIPSSEIIELTSFGRLAFEMLGLDGVPEADLENVLSELQDFLIQREQYQNQTDANKTQQHKPNAN